MTDIKKLIVTDHIYPPIPDRRMDWAAWWDWDDGGETMTGYGETEQDAVIDLIQQSLDNEKLDGETLADIVNLALEGWRAGRK